MARTTASTPLSGVFAFIQAIWNGVPNTLIEPVVIVDENSLLGLSIEQSGTAPSTGVGVMPVAASGTLQASAAQTADGNSTSPVSTLTFRELLAFLNVSAASGAASTLQVFVQSQDPLSSNWADVADFGLISFDGTNLSVNQVPVALNSPLTLSLGAHPSAKALTGSSIRVRWEARGGASFTFSVGYVGK